MTIRPDAIQPAAGAGRSLERFAPTVRWVHQLTGALMLVLIATAAVLYNGSLAVLVGHRYVVETVHVWSGIALPLPILAGLVSRAYRDDARRLNHFTTHDWAWLRSRTRREGQIPVGKFNAGQKVNASLSAGSIAVLLVTGLVMYLTRITSLDARSGATFVHDWFSLALGLLVVGHLSHAFRDRDAMTGMRTGTVPLRWARREHGAWAREMTREDPPDAG